MRAIGTEVIPVLGFRPASGLHAVTDDGSEGADREVLVTIEGEKGRAAGAVTDNGESDD
jgi:hypothetical protein